jgi:hypothetical protein
MALPPQPLNDGQRRLVCALLALGATRRSAAEFADCRRLDLEAELKRDPAFKLQVLQSELRPEINNLRTLLEAARDPKQWRAAAWALERLYPERYAPQKRNTLQPHDLQIFEKDLKLRLAKVFAKNRNIPLHSPRTKKKKHPR